MPELHGETMDSAARAGSLTPFGGRRQVTAGEGVERGLRLPEVLTGASLCFTAIGDRAMDIGEVSHAGPAIGRHSPTGFHKPGLHEPEGEDGVHRMPSFSGFLATGGLDHIHGAQEVDAMEHDYPGRARVRHGPHGRIESDLGGNESRATDRVLNAGFGRTPHMMLYHRKIAYPVQDGAGARAKIAAWIASPSPQPDSDCPKSTGQLARQNHDGKVPS